MCEEPAGKMVRALHLRWIVGWNGLLVEMLACPLPCKRASITKVKDAWCASPWAAQASQGSQGFGEYGQKGLKDEWLNGWLVEWLRRKDWAE